MPLLLLLLAACAPEEDEPVAPQVAEWCDPVGDPTVEIGADPDAFAPVGDTDMWLQIFGPQGGYHLEVALLPSGLDVYDGVDVVLTALVDGQVAGGNTAFLDYRCTRQLKLVAEESRVYLDAPLEDGTIVTVEVQMEDPYGVVATAQATCPVQTL